MGLSSAKIALGAEEPANYVTRGRARPLDTRSPKIYAVHRPAVRRGAAAVCRGGGRKLRTKFNDAAVSPLVARQIESSGTCFGSSGARDTLSRSSTLGNVEISRALFNDSRAIRSKMHTPAAPFSETRGLSRTNGPDENCR